MRVNEKELSLRKLLLPPFESNGGGAVLNKDGTIVVILYGDDLENLGEFVAQAINEKCEHIFGKSPKEGE